MKTLHLHGHLAEKFGPVHRFDVETVPEFVRAMCANHKEFGTELSKGAYKVVRGDVQRGFQLDERSLGMRIGSGHVHFVPAPEGSKGSTGKIILGTVIMAAAIFASGGLAAGGVLFGAGGALSGAAVTAGAFSVSYGQIAMIGLMTALGGVSAALSPSPKGMTANSPKDRRESFIYDGPVNSAVEGSAVPLAYGEVELGSFIMSVAVDTGQL